jgi:hypothetical protein
MPYSKEKPSTVPSADELRSRIPGWGADLDPADRPSVPRERFDPAATGAHWDLPEDQPEKQPRERSIEHGRLTPAFGTAQPLHGVSGAVRRVAYARYSEGRLAHWLLLMFADRADATGARFRSYVSARPDNVLTETGVLSERRRHGIRSRAGRPDVHHMWIDPIIAGGPALLRAAVALAVTRKIAAKIRGRARSAPARSAWLIF